MKKTLALLVFLICTTFNAQVTAPKFINYQAIIRDASGVPVAAGTTVNLNVKIFNDGTAASLSYEENHSGIVVPPGSIVNIRIGNGTGVAPNNNFSSIQWNQGQAEYQISLNGTPLGPRTPFASVPFALNAGGGPTLPNGTPDQTMYFDATLSAWKATSNLANDGTRIGIGVAPNSRVKLHVNSTDFLDSTVVYATKFNAGASDAIFRGFISGTTNTTVTNPYVPIIGADIRAHNNGNGFAVGIGSTGSVLNAGTAVGVSATAKGPASSTLVGLYASVDTVGNPNTYAAIFEKGKILVGDVVAFPNSTATPGSVYKIDAQKRGYWAPAGTSTISVTQGGIISVNPNGPGTNFVISAPAPSFLSSGLGTITLSSYPNYIFNLPTPSFNFNSATGVMSYNQGTFVTSANLSPSLSMSSGTILNVAGNSIGIPPLSFWVKPSGNTLVPGNLLDQVGIGLSNPTFKLDVAGNTRIADVNAINGFVTNIENNIPSSGQGSGVLKLTNNFQRTINNKALLVENFVTKVGGSGSTKTGIEVQSTGSWAPGTGQPNVGIFSNVNGADFNYPAIFMGGQVGIGVPTPKSTLAIAGSIAVKKIGTSGAYTMNADDCIVEYSAGGTVTLPFSGACDEGHIVVIRNRSGGNITAQVQGGDYIQRLGSGATASSTTVVPYQAMTLYKSGSGWIEM